MNLYRITQTENDGYDTFDSAIVAALHDATARRTHPATYVDGNWVEGGENPYWGTHSSWASSPDAVTVELIGVAFQSHEGVILASFNAG